MEVLKYIAIQVTINNWRLCNIMEIQYNFAKQNCDWTGNFDEYEFWKDSHLFSYICYKHKEIQSVHW